MLLEPERGTVQQDNPPAETKSVDPSTLSTLSTPNPHQSAGHCPTLGGFKVPLAVPMAKPRHVLLAHRGNAPLDCGFRTGPQEERHIAGHGHGLAVSEREGGRRCGILGDSEPLGSHFSARDQWSVVDAAMWHDEEILTRPKTPSIKAASAES